MENFNYLNFDELQVGLADLIRNPERQAAVAMLNGWSLLGPPLETLYLQFAALPNLSSPKEITKRLAVLKGQYEKHGKMLYFTCQGYSLDPAAEADVTAKAKLCCERFVPGLIVLHKGFAAIVASSQRGRERLATHADDLRSFPLTGTRTLYDVAYQLVTTGEQIDALLTARAKARKVLKPIGRPIVSELRNEAISLLTSLRDRVIEEVKRKASLPRDLRGRIFFKFEELERLHRARLAGSPQPAEAETPATPTVPAETAPAAVPPASAQPAVPAQPTDPTAG